MSNHEKSSELHAWLRFVIGLVSLVLTLAVGSATLYARLCIVETKVDLVTLRIADLEKKVDVRNAQTAAQTLSMSVERGR